MLAVFCGADGPIRRCRPSGGGPPSCGAGAHLAEELDGEAASAAFPSDHEAGLFQQAPVGGGVLDEAGFGLRRPGDREAQLFQAVLQHDVVDAENAAAVQHPSDLREEPRLVLDVHADVEHVGAVEGAGRERQIQGAALPIGDAVREADAGRQGFGDADVFGGEVDAGHPAAVFGREVPRCPAQPGADVEEVQAGADAEPGGKIDRRLPAADMELVDRSQIGRREPVGVLARPRQRVEDRSLQRSVRVVQRHGVFDIHRAASWRCATAAR